MEKKNIKIIVVVIIAVLLVSATATYAWFSIGLTGNGNNDINKVEMTSISLGTIKYEGIVEFQNNGMYPGEIGITSFTIEKGSQNGVGTYEIDLNGSIDSEFNNDVVISLYKSTNGNNVSVTPGTFITTEDISKEDTLVVGSGVSKVYGPTPLTANNKIVLESVNFDTSTLEKTTYYLVYEYKNVGSQNNQMGHNFSGKVEVILTTGNPVVATASETITALFEDCKEGNTAGNPVMMANDDPDGNIRYIGMNPDNYVSFNGEEWRIIGIFNVDDGEGNIESRIKLIRNESIGNIAWSVGVSGVNNGYGVNQWGPSTDSNGDYAGATLMQTLNGDYLNKTGSYATNGLTEESRGLKSVVWNTGTIDGTIVKYSNAKANQWYAGERSDNNGKICSSGTSCNDTVVRTTTWTGKVGLMYPSDYGYATGGGSGTYNRAWCLTGTLYSWNSTNSGADYKENCAETSWLYNSSSHQWTITPVHHSRADTVVDVNVAGYVNRASAYNALTVRPVVYLNSKAVIKDGDGTPGNPYVFGLND